MLEIKAPAKLRPNTQLAYASVFGRFLNFVNDNGLDLSNLPEEAFWAYFKHTGDMYEAANPVHRNRALITVYREHYILWELFRLAGERGLVSNNFPKPEMKVIDGAAVPHFEITGRSKQEIRLPTENNMELMISHLPVMFQHIADCMLDTGARWDEIRQAFTKTWPERHPTGDHGLQEVPVTVKGGRPGSLWVSEEAAASFEALWRLSPSEKARLTNKAFNAAIKQACVDAKLLKAEDEPLAVNENNGSAFPSRHDSGLKLTSHGFRHYYASLFMKQFGQAEGFNPIEALQKTLHHAHPETTWDYVHELGYAPDPTLRPRRASVRRRKFYD
ncbi:hypothetical protein ACFSM5_21220 [Lacibacterium aquatile]|uniref:Site-specific integrase n=1 Tax=Lacibacterium aquatile TaxID=1168082 RepID=A0ABW5DWE2_9PROT